MPFSVHVRGFDRCQRRLREIAREMPEVAQRALRIEAEIEMGKAKERTPVRTGALRASGRVEDLWPQLGVRWAFGGPAINYAIYVHENVHVYHRVGQAKFLESVLEEAAPDLPDRVAARMRELLRGM